MRMKLTANQAMGGLVALTLVVGGGNLWESWSQTHAITSAQHAEDAARKQAGAKLEAKLCSTFGTLAALRPPPGDPLKNPSRAYEQEQHAILVQLGTDLGCKSG